MINKRKNYIVGYIQKKIQNFIQESFTNLYLFQLDGDENSI